MALSSQAPVFAASAGGTSRLFAIDFWRGLALVIIFVDHFPGNPIERFTITGISFADAAAVFFFLSGFVSFIAFSSLIQKQGWTAFFRRLLRRIGTLYLAHGITVIGALGLLTFYHMGPFEASGGLWSRSPETEQAMVAQPRKEFFRSMLLNSRLALCNIFPLYILFLALVPLAMALVRLHWLALLGVSGSVWAACNGISVLTDVSLAVPVSDVWIFPPAWQFVFFAGFVLGHLYRDRQWQWGQLRPPFLVAGVAVAVLVAAFEIINQSAIAAGAPQGPLPPVATDKRMAAPTYLLSFALLFILARHLMPDNQAVTRLPGTSPVRRLGRHSLLVWTLSILACYGVQLASLVLISSVPWRYVFQLVLSFIWFALLAQGLRRLPGAVSRRSDFSKRPAASSLRSRSR